MTQLSEDCFAQGGELMLLDEALTLIEDRVQPISGFETVPLLSANGRILSQDVVAANHVPPYSNSAVDGYAVYFDDLAPDQETVLPLTGRIAAGAPMDLPMRRGGALRVFTGAMLPVGLYDTGPDTVFMQEDCRLEGSKVIFPCGIKQGANRRERGEDAAVGDTVLSLGRRLRAADLGLAAAVGYSELDVFKSLHVGLFSTGDEIREPGDDLAPGQIFDSNRVALRSMLISLGCRVNDLGILKDDRNQTIQQIEAELQHHDVLISSGGVSVGEEDHVRTALETLGRIDVWRLAIKPGRPLVLGMLNAERGLVPYLGLPGNPAAVIVTFLTFARPLVLRLAGAKEPRPHTFPVRAGFPHRKKKRRREFVRCVLEKGPDGFLLANKAGNQGAGILSAVSLADGLVELPEDMQYLKSGELVDFVPFKGLE